MFQYRRVWRLWNKTPQNEMHDFQLQQADRLFSLLLPERRALEAMPPATYKVAHFVTASTLNVSLHHFSAASAHYGDTAWQNNHDLHWLHFFCQTRTDSYLQREERREGSGTVECNTTFAKSIVARLQTLQSGKTAKWTCFHHIHYKWNMQTR